VEPPANETERLKRDLKQERQPAFDRNGRVKSAILNALYNMGEQANIALASGRPIDEYAIASIAGRGIGSGAAGAINPALDEDNKRRMRMDDLEQQIANQLKIERQQAEIAKTNADADYTRDVRPEVEAAKARARDKPPKPFIIGGKRINYRRPDDWDGEPGQWEPYEETVKERPIDEGSKLIEDKSKVPDEGGLLAKDRQRADLFEQNNKFKSEESQKNRDFRATESEKDRKIKRAALSERIAARLEHDKQARVSAGQAVSRIKISVANAKIEADKWGVNVDDYIDALSDNGVAVVKK
jgi:hypothetical protein